MRTIGSVNLDFRSLYLHYENGVWICDAPVLDDIRRDMEAIMAVSHRMTLEEIAARPWWEKLLAPRSTCCLPDVRETRLGAASWGGRNLGLQYGPAGDILISFGK